MKKLTTLICALAILMSCKSENKESQQTESTTAENTASTIAQVSNDIMENAVIYEANIRQYSKEGTFDSFTKDIPELKKLGVKIIWLMPIHPISLKNRKAKGDLMVHDIKDEEERKQYLGSYYSAADYKGINPEFGNATDLKELIETAHKNGMYVILDWVANHTGWDHPWIIEHPEFYTKNDKGEIIDPTDPRTGKSWGWTDVADLNYDNKELWQEMTNDMNYWLTDFDIDGFRCDVAGEVPTPFWEFATKQLRATKPVFMLAESEEKSLFNKAFDMGYNWEGHHIMNEMAKGHKAPKEWNAYMKKTDTTYQKDDFLMNFVTNHDENSWNGTIEERMGEGGEAMLAFSYMLPGMPLIYSGQEYDMNHRLKFFEKDEIPKTKNKVWPILEKLGKLKNTSSALHGGKHSASYQPLETGDDRVMAFTRSKNSVEITYIANFSKESIKINAPIKGQFLDYMNSTNIKLNDDTLLLQPWDYKILVH